MHWGSHFDKDRSAKGLFDLSSTRTSHKPEVLLNWNGYWIPNSIKPRLVLNMNFLNLNFSCTEMGIDYQELLLNRNGYWITGTSLKPELFLNRRWVLNTKVSETRTCLKHEALKPELCSNRNGYWITGTSLEPQLFLNRRWVLYTR